MKANRAFRLLVTRAGRLPGWLADPNRIDHVELVAIDTGEVVLFWDCAPRDARRLAHALRADLVGLETDEFIARWRLNDANG